MPLSFDSNGTRSRIIHNGAPVHEIDANGLKDLALVNLATEAKPLGAGQTWQQLTVGTQRVVGTTYTNDTGRPIAMALRSSGTSASHDVRIFGVILQGVSNNGQSQILSTFTVIPAGAEYSVTSVTGTLTWWELR